MDESFTNQKYPLTVCDTFAYLDLRAHREVCLLILRNRHCEGQGSDKETIVNIFYPSV